MVLCRRFNDVGPASTGQDTPGEIREHVIGRGQTHMGVAERRQGTVRGSVPVFDERATRVAALNLE